VELRAPSRIHPTIASTHLQVRLAFDAE